MYSIMHTNCVMINIVKRVFCSVHTRYTHLLVSACLTIRRAVGHKMYGPRHKEQLSDAIRRAAECCNCLQCFFVIHSMGGG